LPGAVLSIEGLGSGRGTQPARIVRWVAPLTSKRPPPARAAQQRVPARPFAFGFALLRRACVCGDLSSDVPNVLFLEPLERPMRTTSSALRDWKERTQQVTALDTTCDETFLPIVLCFALRAGAGERPASNASVRALLASEAGRAARAAVAQQCNE
jgi:hypothetical protein